MNLRKKFSGQIIVISLFLGISIFSMMTGFVFEYTKAKEYKKEIASLNKQLKKTEIQINSLKKDEKSYEGDLEDIARKRLNMVKPNETVYVDINRWLKLANKFKDGFLFLLRREFHNESRSYRYWDKLNEIIDSRL